MRSIRQPALGRRLRSRLEGVDDRDVRSFATVVVVVRVVVVVASVVGAAAAVVVLATVLGLTSATVPMRTTLRRGSCLRRRPGCPRPWRRTPARWPHQPARRALPSGMGALSPSGHVQIIVAHPEEPHRERAEIWWRSTSAIHAVPICPRRLPTARPSTSRSSASPTSTAACASRSSAASPVPTAGSSGAPPSPCRSRPSSGCRGATPCGRRRSSWGRPPSARPSNALSMWSPRAIGRHRCGSLRDERGRGGLPGARCRRHAQGARARAGRSGGHDARGHPA